MGISPPCNVLAVRYRGTELAIEKTVRIVDVDHSHSRDAPAESRVTSARVQKTVPFRKTTRQIVSNRRKRAKRKTKKKKALQKYIQNIGRRQNTLVTGDISASPPSAPPETYEATVLE